MPAWEKYEQRDKVIWEKLCELEPRLIALHKELSAIKDDKRNPSFCANRVWYGADGYSYKHRLNNLVGWEADTPYPELRTSQAYDVAYRMLYSALPDCRNCGCY